MPQISNWTIPNSGGSTFRATLNTTLAALQSSSSGPTAPSPTVAGMLWYDTANSILKRRNTANSAWIDVNSDTLGAQTVRGNSSGSAAAEQSITMATLRTMLGFSQSLLPAGYVELPGGVIIQWFTAGAVASGANSAVTFPTTFPTGVVSIQLQYYNTGSDASVGDNAIAQVRATSVSGLTIRNIGPASAVFNVLAIGY